MTPIPETIDEYRQRCEQFSKDNAKLSEINAQLAAENQWLKEQFRLAQRRQFGSSSEKTPAGQQELIFNEAEVIAEQIPEPTVETITYKRRKVKGQREAQIQKFGSRNY